MKNATMLYKAPGPEPIHGAFLATLIVDADEEGAIEAAQADGWFLTTSEAIEAHEAAKAAAEVKLEPNDLLPPTRAELEAKATELGIKFNEKTSDKKLGDLIKATLEV